MLIIFIKTPRLGYVKTRLARTIGEKAALEVYRYLLGRTREVAQSVNVPRMLFYSEQVNHKDGWSSGYFDKRVQAEGNLGHRMLKAFEAAFDNGAKKAVIIGSDCPDISAEVIQQAFDALDGHDLVLGPSEDGGYYLMGMNQLQHTLFSDIEWSTDTVLRSTLEKARAQGLKTQLLQVLNDIDDESDWQAYLRRHPELKM